MLTAQALERVPQQPLEFRLGALFDRGADQRLGGDTVVADECHVAPKRRQRGLVDRIRSDLPMDRFDDKPHPTFIGVERARR